MNTIDQRGGAMGTPAPAGWCLEIWKVATKNEGPCYLATLYEGGRCVLPGAIGCVGRAYGTRFTVFTHGAVWKLIGSSTELVYRAFVRYLSKTWSGTVIKYNTYTLESAVPDLLVCDQRELVTRVELKHFEPFIDPNLLY